MNSGPLPPNYRLKISQSEQEPRPAGLHGAGANRTPFLDTLQAISANNANFATMRVLVTGASGFIGSHVVEATVRAGHAVRALVHYNSQGSIGNLSEIDRIVRDECEIQSLDIQDQGAVHHLIKGVDAIFHLAALIAIPYSYVAPSSYVSVNVNGTLNVLNAARRHDVSLFVHTSTSEVYGTAQYVPIDEKHPVVGQSPYSASKIGADKIAESFALSYEMPVITIRPFNTYGPRQSERAIIPTLATQLLDPAADRVRVGNLAPVRDFTFVTDTANAYLLALDRSIEAGTTLNLGTGRGFSIGEIYQRLQTIIGIEKVLVEDAARMRPARSEVMQLLSDNSKALDVLGWKPEIDFDSGLKRVVEYWRGRSAEGAGLYHV
jgi:NAD dependent epimerase/dehydratase